MHYLRNDVFLMFLKVRGLVPYLIQHAILTQCIIPVVSFQVETLGGELFEEEVQRIRAKASSTPKKKQDRSKSSEKPCSPSKRVVSSVKVQYLDDREPVRSKSITDGSDIIVSSPRRGTRGLNKPTEVGALNGSPRKRVASPRKILHLEDRNTVPSISSLDEDNRNASLLQASTQELNESSKNGLFDNVRRPCTPRKKLKYEVAPSKAEKVCVFLLYIMSAE